MDSEQWSRYMKIFSAARKLESGAREQYLEEACHHDEELKKQVEQLLGYLDGLGLVEGYLVLAEGKNREIRLRGA